MKPALILTFATLLATSAGPAAAEDTGRIEEIVVTAQKKEENIQDVPISITALGGDLIHDAGLQSIHDLMQFAPNVHHENLPSGATAVFIRGFGTPFGTTALDPSVGLALDELVVNQQYYFSDPIYDIERFEVLRGPQGTLFGRNTSAGLFNVTTGMPTHELAGYALGRIGGLGEHRFEAALGGPLWRLGDLAQFRLAVLESEQVNDVENTKLGRRSPDLMQRAARLKLAVKPLDDLDVLLVAEATRTSGFGGEVQAHAFRESSVRFLRQFDPRFEDDPFNHRSSVNFPDSFERLSHRVQLNARYSLGTLGPLTGAELVAIVGQAGFDSDIPFDFDFSPADIVNVARPAIFRYDQLSAEVRLSAGAPGPFHLGNLELLSGLFLLKSNLLSDLFVGAGKDFDQWLTSAAAFEVATGQPPPGGVGFEDVTSAAAAFGVPSPFDRVSLKGDGLRLFSNQRTRAIAPFRQVSWSPIERWSVGAGARLTYETKQAHLSNDCLNPGVVCAVAGAKGYRLDLDRAEANVSSRFSLQYFPSDELSLFAVRATGFKSGGFNNTATTPQQLEVGSENATSWELGAKGTLFEGALSYGATLFQMDVDDLQLQTFVGTLVVVRNAGSARSRGLEIDFRWRTPWRLLSLEGAGSLTDPRFTEFRNATPPRSSGQSVADFSGRRLPYVSERQLTVTPTLRIPLPGARLPLVAAFSEALALTMALDIVYASSFYPTDDLDPVTRQNAYTLLHGRIGFCTLDDRMSLWLSGRNLTDAGVVDFATRNLLFPNGFSQTQEFQRNWGVELRYAW